MKRTNKAGLYFQVALALVGLCEIGWFLWSWADVLAHHGCGGTQNGMNLFVLLPTLFS